jgi:hypothetical protein
MMLLGDKVHYFSYGTPGGEYQSECRLAFVTEVRSESNSYSVVVLNPEGQFFKQDIEEGRKPGQIHHEGHCPNR